VRKNLIIWNDKKVKPWNITAVRRCIVIRGLAIVSLNLAVSICTLIIHKECDSLRISLKALNISYVRKFALFYKILTNAEEANALDIII
jgi:hypothetical protein